MEKEYNLPEENQSKIVSEQTNNVSEPSLPYGIDMKIASSLMDEELIFREQLCEQARRAVEDVKAGRVTSHEELKKRFTQ